MWALTVGAIIPGTAYFVMGLAMFFNPAKFYKFMGYRWEMTPGLQSQTEFAGLWHFAYAIPLLAAAATGKLDVIRHLIIFGGYPVAIAIFYQQWKMVTKHKGMPPGKLKKLHLAPLTMMSIYTLALYFGT